MQTFGIQVTKATTNNCCTRSRSLWTSVVCGIVSLFICHAANAAPFHNLSVPFTQPDGTQVKVIGNGDEFGAVFETATGFTTVFDPVVKAYCYAQAGVDGRLVSTGVQIHQGDPIAMGLAKHIRAADAVKKQDRLARWQKWDQNTQIEAKWKARKKAMQDYAAGMLSAPPSTTTVGSKYGLTLLVDFDDDPATIPQAEIDNFCNSDSYTGFGNNGSVKKYYQDVSNGLLTYSNVVTIYVRIPNSLHPKSYYNDITQDAGHNANEMIRDALAILKALPNFQTEIAPAFDRLTVDGQSQVVAFNVFYAGDNGNVWSMGLWPHSSALAEVGAQDLAGGKMLWRYQVSNIGDKLEIATFCHENGHMLCGFPDLYDYDYDSSGGAGLFCLMGAGTYDGQNPSQVSAYLKRAAGWATTTELNSSSAVIANLSAGKGTNFNHFFRFEKPGMPTEYYLAECRFATGRDAGLPGSGIAIWHIDELGDRDNQSLVPNSYHANYEATLVQADNAWDFEHNVNQGDANDLYYSANAARGYANELSESSSPSSQWWDGTSSGLNWHDFTDKGLTMTFTAGTPAFTVLAYQTNIISGGNGNGLIDFNECNAMDIVVTNRGDRAATGVKGSLVTTTPGVFIAQSSAAFPDVPGTSSVTNKTAFRISTAPTFVPGTPIDFTLVLSCDQNVRTNKFRVATGIAGVPLSFENGISMPIPDGAGSLMSTVSVAHVNGAISKLTASLYVVHPFDAELTMELISPNGTIVKLASANGGLGTNFGINCLGGSTIFDDDAAVSVAIGTAPFVGKYRPLEPLSAFTGQSGTNLNGDWILRITDGYQGDAGALVCWSLNVTPAFATDGGGECPGVDLSVRMTASPNPVSVGSPLTYTMVISNAGPSTAKGVSLSQTLPADSAFVSAVLSQGNSSESGGLLSMSLGSIPAAGSMTATVTVIPSKSETVSSIVTVGSPMTDYNTGNNWVSVSTFVEEARADLSLTVTDSPDPVLAGGTLTYQERVVNRGPSSASGVIVTNVLPASLTNIVVQVSQGTYVLNGNMVLVLIGALDNGADATVTISGTPLSYGAITANAQVVSDQSDPLQNNNTATVTTTVNAAADLAVGIMSNPDPVAINGLLTNSVTVKNVGPGAASGVKLSYSLPAAVSIVSLQTSQGSVKQNGSGLVSADFGTLAVGGNAVLTVIVRAPGVAGTLTSTATVSGSQGDPNLGNNTVSSSSEVMLPVVIISPAGSALVAEGITPTNGVVDPGEKVTVQLQVRNAGTITATNVMISLQAVGGVTAPTPTGWQSIGNLTPSALSSNLFSFTATNAGDSITATLLVQVGTNLFTNSFVFPMPLTTEFSNTNAIEIPSIGFASPYPSPITVSGLAGVVERVTVKLNKLSHTYPNDVSVLLVGPAGRSVVLMSHPSTGQPPVTGVTLSFDDAASMAVPFNSILATGKYHPAMYSPTPVFTNSVYTNLPSGTFGTSLGVFGGLDPNGTWQLYVVDDSLGDLGRIAEGWSVAITTVTPTGGISDLAVSGVVSTNGVVLGHQLTYTLSVSNSGPHAAESVLLTNQLPAGVTFVSCSGASTLNGQTLVCNVGTIPAQSAVSVNVVVQAKALGTLVDVVSVGGAEIDLNLANNTTSLSSLAVSPNAEIAVKIAGSTSVTTDDSLNYTITAQNNGPDDALAVILTNALPVGFTVNSVILSQGTCCTNGSALIYDLGLVANGGVATIQVAGHVQTAGTYTNLIAAGTASIDPYLVNNTASAVTTVTVPVAILAPCGAKLINESFMPHNLAVDPGETVTVVLSVTNSGKRAATNLVATLQTGAGISSSAPVQGFGTVAPGATASATFTFTASSSEAASIMATLALADGAQSLGNVSYTFMFPGRSSFANTNAIVIPDSGPAVPYASVINVSGVTGALSKLTVTLSGVSHHFPRDINAMLVSPTGRKLVLMSHAGGAYPLENVTLTFTNAPAAQLPLASQIASGIYQPSQFGNAVVFPGDASVDEVSSLAGFDGTDLVSPTYPNGDWSLFVYDDNTGDSGVIASGWTLSMTTVQPLNVQANLGLTMSGPALGFADSYLSYTNTVVNSGPNAADHVLLTNRIPNGATLVSVSMSQGTYTTNGIGDVLCDFGSLPAGLAAQTTVKVLVLNAGTFVNSASIGSDAIDSDTTDNSAEITTSLQVAAGSRIEAACSAKAIQLTVKGQPGSNYKIQVSTDLKSWSDVTNFIMPEAGFTFSDMFGTNSGSQARFYRGARVR